jgi:hypothetical protein
MAAVVDTPLNGEVADLAPAAETGMEASDSDAGSLNHAAKESAKPEAPGLGLHNDLVRDFVPSHMKKGVLIPLKTTLEVRQDHTLVQAYITRAPTKAANDVVT